MTAFKTEAPPRPSGGRKLTVSLGLVNVGISFVPLTASQAAKGRMLCPDHQVPIRYEKRCTDGDHLCDDTVTGYEWNGHFLVLDATRFEAERDGRIELERAVDVAAIDPLYFEKTYIVYPQPGHEQGFDLLAAALRETTRAALGRTVLSKKTVAVVLRHSDALGGLVMHVCTYDAAVRWNDAQLVRAGAEQRPKPDPAQLEMAKQLLATLPADYDPELYVDDYDLQLRDAIEAAATGKKLSKPTPRPVESVPSIIDALHASIAEAKAAKPRKTNPAAKKPARKKVAA